MRASRCIASMLVLAVASLSAIRTSSEEPAEIADAAPKAEAFEIPDVRGDDWGAGGIMYPNRPDYDRGDLDLVSFRARPGNEGTWFTAEFNSSVRSPEGVFTEVGQFPMTQLARYGFYTINVDVYIDIDREPGSGRVMTAPGRRVDVRRTDAWERCVLLTPRPDVARNLLGMRLEDVMTEETRATKGRVAPEKSRELNQRARALVSDLCFFPTKIRVVNRRIDFWVPDEFLGGPASPEWGYTVLVTGSDPENLSVNSRYDRKSYNLLMLPIGRGMKYERFGLRQEQDIQQPQVIDLLAPDPEIQARVLSDYDVAIGRLAQIPAAVPDDPDSQPRIDDDVVVAVLDPGTPDRPVESNEPFADPPGSTATTGGYGKEAPRSIPSRLRSLNALLEQGLITEEEYQQLRRKVLSEL